MIDLMKHVYMMNPEKVQEDLDRLWDRYTGIIAKEKPSWEEVNEARAILYLTGQVFCEQIAVKAIERRLHLLKTEMTLIEFFTLIDQNSEKLAELRNDELFDKLERFYRVLKGYKNKYIEGKHYLEEEKFIKKHEEANPDKGLKMGYKGRFKN